MYFGYAIIGLVLGVLMSSMDRDFQVVIAGIVIAVLLARIVKLDRRLKRLESSDLRRGIADRRQDTDRQPDTAPVDTASPWFEDQLQPVSETKQHPEQVQSGAVETGKTLPLQTEPVSHEPPGPSLLQVFLNRAANWVTTGNVPVKVGVIITFIGMGFLLKYAIDHQLLVVPIELRLLAVAAAGLAMLLIGWKLRPSMRVYGLSLQGGGVGLLYLTIFAALRIWQLLPASLTFVLLVLLTALTGWLALLQNARMMIILGVVGGFLAPILSSTGQGSHVVLFSYYLVLNAAILGVAWFRSWRGLNLVGWVFTFLAGSAWGYQYYTPELLRSTQPFLVLFFLFYQAIAILFAIRQPPRRIGVVDGTLVFGTPVIVFMLQAALVEGIEYGLAISSAVAAIFYASTATWLWRSRGPALRLLTESFIALAVVFGTITIPLALDARWTAAAWAAEGAALVWVGTRQSRQLAKLAGTLLVFFSGLSFIDHGWRGNTGPVILNGNVLGGLLISVSAFFSARQLESKTITVFEAIQKLAAMLLLGWAVLWWLGTGWMEISDRAVPAMQFHLFLVYLSASTALATWFSHWRNWSGLRRTAWVLLPFLALMTVLYLWEHSHFLKGPGWFAWPLALLTQVYVLFSIDREKDHFSGAWHLASLLLFTVIFAFEAMWRVDQIASADWVGATAAMLPGIVSLLVWRIGRGSLWPVAAHTVMYMAGRIVLVASQVLILTVLAVNSPGNPEPLPYIPLFNPFGLGMLIAALTTWILLRDLQSYESDSGPLQTALIVFKLMLATAFFILTTAALIRGVHHYTSVPWDSDALFDDVIVQTGLSIYWGLLGFTGMIWGARISHRPLWLTGVGFMVLVIIKLFLVDLGNTGTVERIVSFIGIGALLLVVGYFAPAPPRAGQDP